ncbi:MAG TPA: ribosomal protein S18-alanine N-acetyltransferase [Candidatus Polarisedimenticolaceae bacterium]|nr:ribosomal protein S18-alanine N-acetyltransferase [Candidatus Polarisedimenticolaceae bacterium]
MSEDALRVDSMTIAELPDVLAIERASFDTPWTEENFRHEIERNPRAWNVVARRGGTVVGFACAYLVAGELMINDVAVAPIERRSGVGRAIVTHLLDGAKGRRCRRATLEVRPSNVGARRLYEDLGFEAVGRRRGYYSDTGEDAVLMARSL